MNVLKFLAAHPTETFTLAEIARHVGLTNGSAHRLLTTMAAGQFLSRNEKHRTYSLGVAMVAIGQAAIEKHRGVEIARREIARLAVELNVQCSANALVDNELVVLVTEGTAQSHLGLTRVGERRPLAPPVGLCHIAWSDETTTNAYLEQATAYLSQAAKHHLINSLPIIRSRGYAAAANGSYTGNSPYAAPVSDEIRDAAYWQRVIAQAGELSIEEIQLLDLAQAQNGGVSYLAAPVFSADKKVAFVLVLSGLPTGLSVRELESCAERLCATSATITSEIHGRRPNV